MYDTWRQVGLNTNSCITVDVLVNKLTATFTSNHCHHQAHSSDLRYANSQLSESFQCSHFCFFYFIIYCIMCTM